MINSAAYNTERQPNIIYILADDMGYGDISCFNENSKIHTPCLDQMANEGLRFTDAHSSSAVCTPSRYSIVTGRYNWRSRLKDGVLWGYSEHLIEEGRMTAASLLKQAGYRTACIGKWHLGMDWEKTGDKPEDVDFTKPVKNGPNSVGFDYYYGISASLDMPPYVYIENDRVTKLPDRVTKCSSKMSWWREGPTGANFRHEEVLPKLTEKVLDYIDANSANPFFIYYPLPAPHTPILPAENFKGKSGTNLYGDFVLMCDAVVGQIIKKLDEKGLSEDTIVIYTSDNGCSPEADYPDLAKYGHNPSYIFRGHKADIFEGGHRIPLIVKWPGKIKPGRVSDEPVCLSDFMSTMAELVGIKLPDNAGEDSISNLSIWLGKPLEKPLREAIVHHSIEGSFSIRMDSWKLEMCPGSGGWSYPKPGEEPEGAPKAQLYDLSKDISERENVIDQYPDIADRMKNLLKEYILNGRSTPGEPQRNTGPEYWEQLAWMNEV